VGAGRERELPTGAGDTTEHSAYHVHGSDDKGTREVEKTAVVDNAGGLRASGTLRYHTDDKGDYRLSANDDIDAGGKVAKF
jgi:hypothetical protein